jgi:hypothetical protein
MRAAAAEMAHCSRSQSISSCMLGPKRDREKERKREKERQERSKFMRLLLDSIRVQLRQELCTVNVKMIMGW